MERTLSVIKDFNLSKDQIDTFISQALNDIYNGSGDVLEMAICLSSMEAIVKGVRAGVKDLILSESEKYGDKSFEYKGALITRVNRASYDYSNCDAWIDIDNKKKAIEKTMKAISTPVADAESGEMIYPAIKKETESISIKIK